MKKSILEEKINPEVLEEMPEWFKWSEEFLDLEVREEDPLMKQIDEIQTAVLKATPEQLGQMQKMLQSMGIGKIVQASA